MKTILVTGGLGYIGSHTVVELIQSNYKVIIIDDLSNTNISVLDSIHKITGMLPTFYPYDLKNEALVSKVFNQHCFDGVIHFAAYKSVGKSQKEPLHYYKNNLYGLINLLQEMERNTLTNFIFSSSCTVYGQADKMPIDENTPLKKPESTYGKTKQMGEEIIEDFVKAYTKKATILRYFNPIGSHPSGLIGELPNGAPDNLIPYVAQVASGIRDYLSIFGKNYPTPDGTAIRDYIYVKDLAEAHVSSLNNLLNNTQKQGLDIYNLGTGKGHSVLEIVKTFEKVNLLKIPYKIEGKRPGDITIAYANANKAKNELNWQTKTTIEEALISVWNWQKTLKEKEKL
ncbi:UDP-glucose 4-epimerase [Mesonia hippocampi]|uniref:UDP-glucose 4-epimerase n=1 Tax=Mesonia hippocampi TaxID=1628250 RepID=A0A840EPD5_9FLAO|nr:UDP-glucose 4-epimerase GalE [Mesonia hippocampi]MBB4118463.1 UDP-glucose 4-epimerase [Mesonia hippocampi]